MSEQVFLPARPGEADDERRLREALNRNAAAMLRSLDASIALRTAPPEAQRMRHLARNDMISSLLKAMHAYAITQARAEA